MEDYIEAITSLFGRKAAAEYQKETVVYLPLLGTTKFFNYEQLEINLIMSLQNPTDVPAEDVQAKAGCKIPMAAYVFSQFIKKCYCLKAVPHPADLLNHEEGYGGQ